MKKPGDKIRVLHLVASWIDKIYGGEAMALALAQKTDRNKFEPVIACFKDGRSDSPPPLIGEASRSGINTEVIELSGRYDIRAVFRLKELLEGHGTDILHCHAYKADTIGFLTSKLSRVKLVSTCHGWWPNTFKLRLYDMADMFALARFDKVIAVSEKIRNDMLSKKIDGSRIEVILNGINIDNFSLSVDIEKGRRELGISGSGPVVGSVGRLSGEKGIRYLLEAALELRDRFPGIRFLITGDGDERPALAEYARKAGLGETVIFAGYRRDVSAIYPLLDVFVIPSITEGIPLSLLEAMASAKAIVATKVGGIPSVVRDGENGVLVEPQNTGALAAAIAGLLSDKAMALRFGQKAKEAAGKDFSIESAVRKYERIYSELAE